jgi:hypothetical protein
MECPTCHSEVPRGAEICPTCGTSLGAVANPSLMSTVLNDVSDRVPLAMWQKAWLLFGCVPFVFFLIMFAVYVPFLREVLDEQLGTASVVVYLFAGVVLLVLGFQAVQRLRDLFSGVAIVREDVLQRSWRTGGRGRQFFGNFNNLGKMRLMPNAHFQSQRGVRSRVVYSPVSKIVWSIEPLN